jgi:OOP family OmpA-OmpF porin
MKMKLLGLAVLTGLCASQSVAAQDFDNRWYLSGTVGYLWPDERFPDLVDERDVSVGDDIMWGVGVGKRITPNFALDLEYTWAAPDLEYGSSLDGFGGDLDVTTLELIGRIYFGGNFYVALGIGGQTDEYTISYDDGAGYDYSESFDDSGFVGRLGLGFESDNRSRVDWRLEAGMRYSDAGDFGSQDLGICDGLGNCSSADFDFSGNTDIYASASLLIKLGDLPVPVVAAPVTCDTQDSDGDGVNDCNDKCPGSAAGQTIGADGCPVKLTIDLKGVNFDFDKDTLRPDAVAILDEAVAVLAKYPELRVEVAGHTDLCGDETYNQNLSQRRSQVVYDYLGSKGIGAERLVGPTGYGESRPLESTEQTSPACKNETNRRTELNVQN